MGGGTFHSFLNRFVNPVVEPILRSPAHRIISRRIALITFVGRTSGRRYTIPIGYTQRGDVVTVVASRERAWWKNLRGGARVIVRLRGKDLPAIGQPLRIDVEAVAGQLRVQYPWLSRRRAATMAADRLLVELRLG